MKTKRMRESFSFSRRLERIRIARVIVETGRVVRISLAS